MTLVYIYNLFTRNIDFDVITLKAFWHQMKINIICFNCSRMLMVSFAKVMGAQEKY